MDWRLMMSSGVLLAGCLAEVEEPPAVLTERLTVVYGHVGRADGSPLGGITVTLIPDAAATCPASSTETVHAPPTLVTTDPTGEYRAVVRLLVDSKTQFATSCIWLGIVDQSSTGAPDTARSVGPVGFSVTSPSDSVRGDVIYPTLQTYQPSMYRKIAMRASA